METGRETRGLPSARVIGRAAEHYGGVIDGLGDRPDRFSQSA